MFILYQIGDVVLNRDHHRDASFDGYELVSDNALGKRQFSNKVLWPNNSSLQIVAKTYSATITTSEREINEQLSRLAGQVVDIFAYVVQTADDYEIREGLTDESANNTYWVQNKGLVQSFSSSPQDGNTAISVTIQHSQFWQPLDTIRYSYSRFGTLPDPTKTYEQQTYYKFPELNSVYDLRGPSSYAFLAASLLVEEDTTIEHFDLYLRKVGSPTESATMVASLYTSTPDKTAPSTKLQDSIPVTISLLDTQPQYIRFTLPVPQTILKNGLYWVVLNAEIGFSSSNYVVWEAQDSIERAMRFWTTFDNQDGLSSFYYFPLAEKTLLNHLLDYGVYYPMDESANPRSAANVSDTSYNLTFTTSASVAGKNGQAADISLSYASLLPDTHPRIDTRDVSFSVACWLNLTGGTPLTNILSQYSATAANQRFLLRVETGGVLKMYYRDSSLTLRSVTHANTFVYGSYQHVAMTIDEDAQEIVLYYNNVPTISSFSSWGIHQPTANEPFIFGYPALGFGALDEVLVLPDYVMKHYEIDWLFHNGVGKFYNDLTRLGYMDWELGSTTFDSTMRGLGLVTSGGTSPSATMLLTDAVRPERSVNDLEGDADEMTISFWKDFPATFTGMNTYILGSWAASNDAFLLTIDNYTTYGYIRFYIQGSSGTTSVVNVNAAVYPSGSHHIAVTMDFPEVIIYVDNVPQVFDVSSVTAILPDSGYSEISIFRTHTTDTDSTRSTIDNIVFEERSLEPFEVSMLYHRGRQLPFGYPYVSNDTYKSAYYSGSAWTSTFHRLEMTVRENAAASMYQVQDGKPKFDQVAKSNAVSWAKINYAGIDDQFAFTPHAWQARIANKKPGESPAGYVLDWIQDSVEYYVVPDTSIYNANPLSVWAFRRLTSGVGSIVFEITNLNRNSEYETKYFYMNLFEINSAISSLYGNLQANDTLLVSPEFERFGVLIRNGVIYENVPVPILGSEPLLGLKAGFNKIKISSPVDKAALHLFRSSF